MRSRPASSLASLAFLAAFVGAGCGQIRLPKLTPAPDLARLKERCPAFTVLSPEWIESGPSDFAGRAVAVVAADYRYRGDLGPWVDFLRGRGGDCAIIIVIEGAGPAMHAELAPSLPSGMDVHFDPPSKWDRVYAESFRMRRRADDARLDSPRKADDLERKARLFQAAAEAREPGFRRALGLVGEGPHVAVIGPDGTLLALVDGPRDNGRGEKVSAAIEAAIAAAKSASQ